MFVGLRACSSLQIFESYRVQIYLFKQVFIDIFWFMSILIMLIILMAIVHGVEFALNGDKDMGQSDIESIRNNFLHNLGMFYQFMI